MAEEEKRTDSGKKKGTERKAPGKIKPKLDKETIQLLEIRREKLSKQPRFRRSEWFRYKRLSTSWRRPRAVTNKQRLNKKYRTPKVRIGFGKPDRVRNLHPSGFREVMVYNVRDLEGMDPGVEAARIGRTVGTRKRRDIIKAADSRGIRVLNRGVM